MQITACQRTENKGDNLARGAILVLSTWRMLNIVPKFLAPWAGNQMTSPNRNYGIHTSGSVH